MKRYLTGLTIGWKIPLITCGLLLAVTVALAWAAFLEVRTSLHQLAEERLITVTTSLVASTQAGLRNVEHAMRTLAGDSAIRGFATTRNAALRPRAESALHAAMPNDTTVVVRSIWDTRGVRLLATGPLADRVATLSAIDPRATLRAGDTAAVGALRQIGDTIVFQSIGLIGAPSRPDGYVVLWRKVYGNKDARDRIARVIGSGAVLLIGGTNGLWADQGKPIAPPPVDVSHLTGVVRYERPGAGTQLAAAGAIPRTPWIMLLEFPEHEILAPARRFLNRVALIGVALLVLALGGVLLLTRHITQPLKHLTRAATSMSAADYSARVRVQGSDELARLAVSFNSMAERIEDEVAARRRSEEQWRMVFEGNPHPMWVFDLDTLKFLAVNTAALRQYRYTEDEFLRMTTRDVLAPDAPMAAESLGQGKDTAGTPESWKHRRKDGTLIDVEIESHTLVFSGRKAKLVLAQDVTQRRLLEEELRQAQKMEAVGRLAGGVAHDFNNLLVVIMTYAELLRGDTPDSDARAKDLDEVIHAARQAHGLTRQLLAFSRQQVLQPAVLDPNVVIHGVERMLARVIGEDIELTSKLHARGQVKIDAGQLEQAVLNLVVNARDAMPDGGNLRIATEDVDIDETDALLHGLPSEGLYVVVSVSDTGVGMTQETQARIFEPFFTTKEPGKGTGLGLATVYGMAKQGGGNVLAYSELGIGSTFRLYLPTVGDGGDAHPALADAPPRRGTETILLVEDDAAVRAVTAEVLERNGYTLLVAPGPDDAIALAERHPHPIHLLLSDVVMPGLDGPALSKRLVELRPEIKSLFMSGYAGDMVFRRGAVASDIQMLEKPFTVIGLTRKVREVLDAK